MLLPFAGSLHYQGFQISGALAFYQREEETMYRSIQALALHPATWPQTLLSQHLMEEQWPLQHRETYRVEPTQQI